MRKDIEIHINTGDITLSPKNKFTLRAFSWVDNSQGLSRYIYGEVEVPGSLSETYIKSNGVYVNIPYTPKYNEFYIRIKRVLGESSFAYIKNPIDGSEWFLVKSGLYGQSLQNTYASQLLLISESSFHIRLNKGIAEIYSSAESDVNIIKANRQNSNLLLKCIPTNSYRYPLSGVGLIRWTNSNISYTKLSNTIQREFENDGVIVKNASYDFETRDLKLELDTTNVDNNGEV